MGRGTDRAVRLRPLMIMLACGLAATSMILGLAAVHGSGAAQRSLRQASPAGAGTASPAPPRSPLPSASKPRPAPSAKPGRQQQRGHVPRRLDVPDLGIDAVVQPIVAKGRVLTPPSDPQQVGWWQDGAEPGAGRGRILITGHTVHTGGGAFDHLDRLRPGDLVAISAKGRRLDYRVQRVFFLTPEQLARRSSTLFGSSGPERLMLVTCAAWDGAAYDGSTVVVAAPDAVGQ